MAVSTMSQEITIPAFYCAGASAPVHILVVFRTTTGAMGLRMRRVNRLDRACAVFYRQLSDISVAIRH